MAKRGLDDDHLHLPDEGEKKQCIPSTNDKLLDKFGDCKFKIQDNEYTSIRFLLASDSALFEAMFWSSDDQSILTIPGTDDPITGDLAIRYITTIGLGIPYPITPLTLRELLNLCKFNAAINSTKLDMVIKVVKCARGPHGFTWDIFRDLHLTWALPLYNRIINGLVIKEDPRQQEGLSVSRHRVTCILSHELINAAIEDPNGLGLGLLMQFTERIMLELDITSHITNFQAVMAVYAAAPVSTSRHVREMQLEKERLCQVKFAEMLWWYHSTLRIFDNSQQGIARKVLIDGCSDVVLQSEHESTRLMLRTMQRDANRIFKFMQILYIKKK